LSYIAILTLIACHRLRIGLSRAASWQRSSSPPRWSNRPPVVAAVPASAPGSCPGGTTRGPRRACPASSGPVRCVAHGLSERPAERFDRPLGKGRPAARTIRRLIPWSSRFQRTRFLAISTLPPRFSRI